MYSGSRPAANSRTAPASPPPPVTVRRRPGPVSHQPPVARGVLPGRHHRLGHPRAAGQHRLHLTRLDPEPADLHLIISPPREHQLPASSPPGQIPGPVHPLPARPQRARHEPLRRSAPPAPDTPAPAPPRPHTAPRHPRRHRAQPPVQHKHPGISHRPPIGGTPAPSADTAARQSTVHRVSVGPYSIDQPGPRTAAQNRCHAAAPGSASPPQITRRSTGTPAGSAAPATPHSTAAAKCTRRSPPAPATSAARCPGSAPTSPRHDAPARATAPAARTAPTPTHQT